MHECVHIRTHAHIHTHELLVLGVLRKEIHSKENQKKYESLIILDI